MKETLKRIQIQNILIKHGVVCGDELVEELYQKTYGGIANTKAKWQKKRAKTCKKI